MRTRRWIVSLALAVSSATLAARPPAPAKTDLDRDELKGPVKSIALHWRANHKDPYGEAEERDLGVSTYGRDGMLISDREFTADFIRDRTPERHGATETVFRAKMGSSLERYVLDAAGNIVEERTWYAEAASGPPNMVMRMTYDAAGHMLTRDVLDDDGKSLDLTVYTRDTTGRVTIEEDRPRDKQPPYPLMHYTYRLDSHGNWIEKDVTRENVPEDDYDSRYAGNLLRTITYF